MAEDIVRLEVCVTFLKETFFHTAEKIAGCWLVEL